MAVAYTPGLKVSDGTVIIKERRLPLSGEVLVKAGQQVTYNQVVARTFLPGNVHPVNGAGLLSLEPSELPQAMLKKAGDQIKKGEIIAQSKGLFGLFKNNIMSPIKGSIEIISNVTGQILLREPPIPVEVAAYVDGVVEAVLPNEGVNIKTYAAFIQGIFGIGGETSGELKVVVNSPRDQLTPDLIQEEHQGKILVGGSLVSKEGLDQAVKLGVKGIVVGGIGDQDLRDFLGYDLGVAITGSEEKGISLIITEGFGEMKMAEKTFALLKKYEGRMASLNGTTQIRAGVMRPEVIIPRKSEVTDLPEACGEAECMKIDSVVRIIREPSFGLLARVVNLPSELEKLATEAKVRVVEVELEDKKRLVLPRANVELVQA